MKMIFEVLYLFAPQEKAAKKIEFSSGLNIITSSEEDGTDRGKSVIMRSLYHALGANACFGSKWNDKDKIYVLRFRIDFEVFFIYRAANLFKIFNSDKALLFLTTSSADLAKFLKNYTRFAVQLPNRTDDHLEITPPVYNYLLYFLDQDKYDGTSYKSFNNLGQYADFKDMVIGYHLGIYNEEYFELIKTKEDLQKQENEGYKRKDLLEAMRRDLEKKLEVPAIDNDITTLNAEIEIYKRNYEEILVALRKSKSNLLNLRNQELETKRSLQELDDMKANAERDLKKLAGHYCPECNTFLENTLNMRSKKYNNVADAVSVKNDLQKYLSDIEKDICSEEKSYKILLEKVNDYEKNVDDGQGKVEDILKYKGLCHVRDDIVNEQYEVYSKLDDIQKEINEQKAKIKIYATKKKKVNEEYNRILSSIRIKFGLNEINPDKFKSIKNTFSIMEP